MKALILAGGTGTRLWPLSREKKPKQFQSLISDKTLFQEAIGRLSFLSFRDIYVAVNSEHYEEILKEAPKIPKENIIVEPALRDTASAIGLATIMIGKKFPNEVMSIIYADHLIKNREEFVKKLKIAEKVAKSEHTINIIEVKATYPNTNLGYVKIGKMLKELDGEEIFSFEKFIEKPDRKTAETFLRSYRYLWNTGYFVWRIKDILKEYQRHLPETYRKLMVLKKALGKPDEKKIIETIYPSMEKISIDYGIMEKVDPKRVRIIPADLGWSDIGNFEALFYELAENEESNVTKGKSINIGTKGSIIYNFGGKIVTTVGLKDTIIINTDDAILICDKKSSKNVKALIQELKKKYPKIL